MSANEDFINKLWTDNHYVAVRQLDADWWIALVRFAYTFGILKGVVGDYTSYEERWCYPDFTAALTAYTTYDGVGDTADGWIKHHPSLRTRRDGDPAKEAFNWELPDAAPAP